MPFIKNKLSNKLNKSFISILILPALFTVAGCYNDKEELLYPGSSTPVDCSTLPASFKTNVLPIIQSKCAISGCHSSVTASGGYTFDNYAQISAAKLLIKTKAVVERSMPPTGPLLPAEVNEIKCWIESGAADN